VNAARWVQQKLLEPNRKATLRVYAVWFKMYPGDAREKWRPQLLMDPRVRHYWDEDRSVGRLYLQTIPALWPARAPETNVPQADALWDAYLLYAADARWTDQPPPVVTWGSTILQTTDTLDAAVAKILDAPKQ
jgi:hypothetical protein